MGWKTIVALTSAVAAVGGLLFGYDTGVISGALLFISKSIPMSTGVQAFVVSSVLIGAMIGAASGGLLADHFGRRWTMFAAGATFTVGALLAALAPEVYSLIAGRIIVGFAIGVASFVVPLYIGEVAPPANRGALVSLNQLLITVGIFASYLVDLALAPMQAWRWMFGLAVIPAILLVIGMCVLPETPRWLIRAGKRDTARKVLDRTRDPETVEAEIAEIDAGLQQKEASWKALLDPNLRRAMIIGIGLALIQQITGINTVIYYGPVIFQKAGFASAEGAILAQVSVGLINVLLTIVSIRLIDRLGRRPLLIYGMAGMVAGLVLLGVTFAFQFGQAAPWIAVVSLMLYVGSFAIGLGPVFWLIIAEIYPLQVRGRAMSVATLANWFGNFVVSLVFLPLVHWLGEAPTFWLYGAVTVLGIVFVRAYVPETKGRTLEDIEADLHPVKAMPSTVPA